MIEIVESDIKAYFDYIKEIYLKTFEKILTESAKQRIASFTNDDIEWNIEEEYHIQINDKISYYLNIETFIQNNDLSMDTITELAEREQEQVKYLLSNKSNPIHIVKDSLLENMILLFFPEKNVLSYGASTYLANVFSKKYNLTSLNTYYKEAEVISALCDLLGEANTLKAIINGNIESLEELYNLYIDDMVEKNDFQTWYIAFQNEFDHYDKNKNKVYYIDSLYNYSNLNYQDILEKIKAVKENQKHIRNISTLRINSIIDCIQELQRYTIILSEEDKNALYYASLNIKRLIEKGDILLHFNEIITQEEKLKSIVNYIWHYYVNYEGEYDASSNYWLLIQNYDEYTDATNQDMHLITNEQMNISKIKKRYQYGFVYKINKDAIIYSSPESIIYRDMKDSKSHNHNTYHYKDFCLEIEEQSFSSLLTPRNLLAKITECNTSSNHVLVSKKDAMKRAVYCICKSEMDANYDKAQDLATKYELPLIVLYESDDILG